MFLVIKMKIIVSPSKTQKPNHNADFEPKELLFPKKHKKILSLLRKQTKEDLQRVMKIKGLLLDRTYQNIKNYSKLDSFQAFFSFDGLVFKNLDKDSYQLDEMKYIESNITVLDAFYGILEPGTLIKPYRLDMKMNFGINLYHHWDLNEYFKNQVIINLASDEFSKLITEPMITISFLQNKNGKFVNQATYSKMARGIMLDYLIKNKITQISDIKLFNKDGYEYNSDLSDDSLIVFTR